MPGDESAIDVQYPDLIISFPDIHTMEMQDLGQILLGFGDALIRVNELIVPAYPLVFRTRIVPGSMDIELFAEKKKTPWQSFVSDNLDELRLSPSKLAIMLTGAGILAGMAYVTHSWGFDSHPPGTHESPTAEASTAPSTRIGNFTIYYPPPNLQELGQMLSFDPIFCRNVGKAYEAIWKNHDIRTMEIKQGHSFPSAVLTRDQIASARLECKFRPKR
jgi:hypothetical protein